MNRKTWLMTGLTLFLAVSGCVAASAQPADRPIIVVMDREPSTMDPISSENGPSTEPLFLNIQEKLTNLDSNGNAIPGLGEWTVIDGGKIIEFKLRHGVKFHSGDPFTAADVLFSHQRGMALSAGYRNRFRGLNRLEVVDDYTVRFIYDRPNGSVLTNSGLEIGSKAYFDRVGEKEYAAHAVGTGPYRLVSYKLGQSYELEAWDGYWGTKKPTIKKIRVVVVKDEATRISMMKAGEGDFLAAVPYKEVAGLKKAGFVMSYADTFPTVALTMQTYNPNAPWAKQKVREAMAHAIDANAIIKGLFDGIPKRFAMLTPGETGYDPDLKPYEYNPALAKKLLTEAGYPNGFSMPMNIATSYYGLKETAEAVVLYLRAVGITVDAKVVDSVTNNAQLRERGKDPTYLYTLLRALPLSNYGDPADAAYVALGAESPNAIYKSENPEFGPLLAAGIGTLDAQKRNDIVKKALRILHDEVGVIPLWHARTVFAMKPNLAYTPIQHRAMLLNLIDLRYAK